MQETTTVVREASRSLDQPAAGGKNTVCKIRGRIKADGRDALTAPEGKQVFEACGTPHHRRASRRCPARAELATGKGFPVVLKIVSPGVALLVWGR